MADFTWETAYIGRHSAGGLKMQRWKLRISADNAGMRLVGTGFLAVSCAQRESGT